MAMLLQLYHLLKIAFGCITCSELESSTIPQGRAFRGWNFSYSYFIRTRKGDWITFSLPSWLLLTRASYLPLHLPNISWCNLDLLSSSTSTSFLTYNLLYLCCGCTIIASQFVLIYTPLTSIDNITSAVIALHIVLLRKLSNVINIKLHNPAMTRHDEHWEGGLWMLGFWLQRQSALPSG